MELLGLKYTILLGLQTTKTTEIPLELLWFRFFTLDRKQCR